MEVSWLPLPTWWYNALLELVYLTLPSDENTFPYTRPRIVILQSRIEVKWWLNEVVLKKTHDFVHFLRNKVILKETLSQIPT